MSKLFGLSVLQSAVLESILEFISVDELPKTIDECKNMNAIECVQHLNAFERSSDHYLWS